MTASGPLEPAPQRVTRMIDSADAIKAIADPLRIRLLQLLMVSNERTWSVKEMASELGQPVTKLYHHVKLLEGADLIRDVDSRIVSGIVEHRYQACQRSMKFDDNMFGSEEFRHESITHLTALFDSIRDDLADYLYREDADSDKVTIMRATSRLTPEEIAEVNRKVEEMVEAFKNDRDDVDRASLPRTQMLFMLSPLGHDPQ